MSINTFITELKRHHNNDICLPFQCVLQADKQLEWDKFSRCYEFSIDEDEYLDLPMREVLSDTQTCGYKITDIANELYA